jgi:hypothetical protein
MRARFSLVLSTLGWLLVPVLPGQVVSYTFGSTSSPTASAASVAANLAASGFASFTGAGTTGVNSPGSSTAGGGGGAYFIASNWRSADGNYLYFTLTPANGFQLSLSSFSFYYASTGTGPTSATLSSSADGYASALGTYGLTQQSGGSLLASDWHQAGSSITLSAITGTTFRISATGASGSTGSFRVDAVTLNGTVSAIPEPSTYAATAGLLGLLLVAWKRQRPQHDATAR